ncbi:hypothetical protein OSJ77_12275 [Phyllobacterium sp. 0TCS1.6C]|uniref:class I SAM-dependent methyltransferase n=1 Tax=unclassified Phyllobacterium TaxID=2638441 RepID=UPI0022646F5B|nr:MULTISPECIES: class I SAM-dependent methyltransferase [unclassified Phyllobacterium]MCX8280971.1 hypothetical protein [Phyllobacterium sp. 0TCS1.6C]MCX8295837.1 hypothetical protein [Phyllobacterium sp. 0TCS1.6A]
MSRLDSFIRRMTAQRDVLNHISGKVRKIDGPIIELGLGNGRTFDHLRELFPDRRIIAFDRAVASHKSSTPDAENLVIGEICESGARFHGIDAALVHADIGTGYDAKDAVTLTWLPGLAAHMLAPGGIVASGLPLVHPWLEQLPLPSSVKAGRYFLYRRTS